MNTTLSWRLAIAGISLAAAVAVYSLVRIHPPQLLQPLQATQPAFAAQAGLFGSLPSLLYTLALGLIIGSFASTRASARWHCLSWLFIALVLELAQHPAIAAPVSAWLPALLPEPAWEIIGPYWTRGSFDPLDLLATFAGGTIAVLLFPVSRNNNDHEAT